MTSEAILPGLTGRAQHVVKPEDLASAYGNPGVDVLSSMTLMTLLEGAAIDAILDKMGPEDMTVGARMEMDHLAPTPEGLTLTAEAVIQEVKGPKLVFQVTAHDGVEEVARAVHVRFLVPKSKFFAGVANKKERANKA